MATREWLITKVALALVSIITIVSICVGASNVVVNLQKDITRVDENQKEHTDLDEKRWERVVDDVEDNEHAIQEIQLTQKELSTQYLQIMRAIEELKSEMRRNFDQWEPVGER